MSSVQRIVGSVVACAVLALAAAKARGQGVFIRGDCNGDGEVAGSSTDAVFLLEHIFLGGPVPPCLEACDVNDDGVVAGQVTDAIYLLSHAFRGGAAPPPPYPECGTDPSPDALDSCATSTACTQPPVAAFTFQPLVGVAPARVVFNARASEDPDGEIEAYDWDFGDGQTGDRSALAHVYEEPGTYAVTLTLTDNDGATTILTKTYVVTEDTHDPRFDAVMTAVRQEMTQLGVRGAAVAIIEQGEVTLARGFGSKHPERSAPVEATTLFRIGSVTKMLTAVGLLRLVDDGVVDLAAPVTDYLQDFSFRLDADWASSISVENLLTHTSAIADSIEFSPGPAGNEGEFAAYWNGPYATAPTAYLMAPPGRMFNYTNPGYALAGLITETVGQTPWVDYMEFRVFDPLGMDRTFFRAQEVIADGDFAYGEAGFYLGVWEWLPETIAPDTYSSVTARPAGFAYSSVLDLAEFVKFLRAGNPAVLSDTSRLAMQSHRFDTQFLLDLFHYGYGLFVQEGGFYRLNSSNFYEMRLVFHGGDVPGFSADVYYVPSLDFAFIALTCASLSHLEGSFLVALNSLAELPSPSPLPDLAMDPDTDYPTYAGEYNDPFQAGTIYVTRTGDQLRVQIPAFQGVVPYDPVLIPNGPDNFILIIGDFPTNLTFILDPEGRAEYFRTRGFVGRRVEEEGAGAALPPPARGLRNSIREEPPTRFARPFTWQP